MAEEAARQGDLESQLATEAKNNVSRRNQANHRRNLQSALINEFKARTTTSHIKPEEVKDGTLEDIILGMKSEPYRANVNEAMRKSFRRQRSEKLTGLITSESEAL